MEGYAPNIWLKEKIISRSKPRGLPELVIRLFLMLMNSTNRTIRVKNRSGKRWEQE